MCSKILIDKENKITKQSGKIGRLTVLGSNVAFFESLISLVLLTIVHYSAVYFGLCFRFEHIVINLNSCSSVVFWTLNVCESLATMPRISLSSLLLLLWSVWLFHLPLFSCAVSKIMVWYKHLVRLAAISPSISYSLRPKESKPVCAYTLNISIYLFAHLLALFLAFISPCCCLLCEIDRLGIYLYIFFHYIFSRLLSFLCLRFSSLFRFRCGESLRAWIFARCILFMHGCQ